MWPSEMLYRSWRTMHDIAGRPCDDWWDLPYATLMNLQPGAPRAYKLAAHLRAKISWHEYLRRIVMSTSIVRLDGAREAEVSAPAPEAGALSGGLPLRS